MNRERRDQRLREVLGHVQHMQGATTVSAQRTHDRVGPFEREVTVRLRRSGASERFIEQAYHAFSALSKESDTSRARHVIDLAAEAIEGLFAIARSPRLRGATRALAFAGPTGGGKTTSLYKLATRLVRGGRRIALATFDTRRVGALETLRTHAELLAVPFFALHDESDFADGRLVHAGLEALLIDTTGNAGADRAALEQLQRSLAAAHSPLDSYLVLPANLSRAAMKATQRAFAPLSPVGAILTKLDETREPAPLLEHVLESELPVAFLSDGPEVERLQRAAGEHFADLLLRGRLA